MSDNTVYALSTAAGKSGVAVFRVSGSDALAVVRCLTALDAGAVVPRHAYFTSLHDLAGEVLDHALVLYFKAPASFTGEDTVGNSLPRIPGGDCRRVGKPRPAGWFSAGRTGRIFQTRVL